jgi:hypothetical protein
MLLQYAVWNNRGKVVVLMSQRAIILGTLATVEEFAPDALALSLFLLLVYAVAAMGNTSHFLFLTQH